MMTPRERSSRASDGVKAKVGGSDLGQLTRPPRGGGDLDADLAKSSGRMGQQPREVVVPVVQRDPGDVDLLRA